jgi:hypothetical protein
MACFLLVLFLFIFPCTVTFAQGSIEDHAKQLANTITALINLPDSELFSVFHIEISGWSIED